MATMVTEKKTLLSDYDNLLRGALGHYDRSRLNANSKTGSKLLDNVLLSRQNDIIELANKYADRTETKAVLAWVAHTNGEREIRDVSRKELYKCSKSLATVLLYAGTLSSDESIRQESIEAFIDNCPMGAQERLAEIALRDPSLSLKVYSLDLLAEQNYSEAIKVAALLLQAGTSDNSLTREAERILHNEPQIQQTEAQGDLLTEIQKRQGAMLATAMDRSDPQIQTKAVSEFMKDRDPAIQLIGAIYFTSVGQGCHPDVSKVIASNKGICDLIIAA